MKKIDTYFLSKCIYYIDLIYLSINLFTIIPHCWATDQSALFFYFASPLEELQPIQSTCSPYPSVPSTHTCTHVR